MQNTRYPFVSVLFLAITVAAGVAGCSVYARPAVIETEVDYEPVTYEGAVVYYDDDGAPFYYVDDSPHFVPRGYVHYGVLVGHYRSHGRAYRTWHTGHPHRSRGHRRR